MPTWGVVTQYGVSEMFKSEIMGRNGVLTPHGQKVTEIEGVLLKTPFSVQTKPFEKGEKR